MPEGHTDSHPHPPGSCDPCCLTAAFNTAGKLLDTSAALGARTAPRPPTRCVQSSCISDRGRCGLPSQLTSTPPLMHVIRRCAACAARAQSLSIPAEGPSGPRRSHARPSPWPVRRLGAAALRPSASRRFGPHQCALPLVRQKSQCHASLRSREQFERRRAHGARACSVCKTPTARSRHQ